MFGLVEGANLEAEEVGTMEFNGVVVNCLGRVPMAMSAAANGVRSRHSTFALRSNAFAEFTLPESGHTFHPSSFPTLAPALALAHGTQVAAVGSPFGFQPETESP